MAWAHEMVQQSNLSFLRISFLVAGHTKFAPVIFSSISQSYDVFTTIAAFKTPQNFQCALLQLTHMQYMQELSEIVSAHATAVVDDRLCAIVTKYSKLPGIRSLHDFLFLKNSANNTVVAKVRKTCPYENTTMHTASGREISEDVIPDPDRGNYLALHKIKSLSESKM